jgi:hypothetical protein
MRNSVENFAVAVTALLNAMLGNSVSAASAKAEELEREFSSMISANILAALLTSSAKVAGRLPNLQIDYCEGNEPDEQQPSNVVPLAGRK